MKEYNQILAEIKKKVYHPVYFLMGDVPYFIDSICNALEKGVLDESEREFNQTVVYGRDSNLDDIIATAKSFPMMANHQVVIVKEAQDLRELTRKPKGEDKNSLELYVAAPQKSTVLVFCFKYKSLDKRTSLAKAIKKHAVLFESKKLYDDKIPEWINGYLKQKKYSIDPKATMLLAESLGNNLSKIANEVEKLTILVPQNSMITVDHIQQNIGISKDYNAFELQAALGKKDVLKANRIVNYFASNTKDNPLVMTISMLYGYFSKILTYHSLSDRSRNNAAAAMGVHPFFVSDYEKAARAYPPGKIKLIISDLREYDLRSKGVGAGVTSDGELLKELVFKIMH